MEDTKFELGPLQKQWIANLRAYPERQMKMYLAVGNKEDYTACCLGELHLTYCRMNNIEPKFDEKHLIAGTFNEDFLKNTESSGVLFDFKTYGLKSENGSFNLNDSKYNKHDSLTSMNDRGVTWQEIADFIEANPKLIFDKAV